MVTPFFIFFYSKPEYKGIRKKEHLEITLADSLPMLNNIPEVIELPPPPFGRGFRSTTRR
jgi:hypothetical protein